MTEKFAATPLIQEAGAMTTTNTTQSSWLLALSESREASGRTVFAEAYGYRGDVLHILTAAAAQSGERVLAAETAPGVAAIRLAADADAAAVLHAATGLAIEAGATPMVDLLGFSG